MKDAEEKMTELTEGIHSLFRGYVNGFHAHKGENVRLESEVENWKNQYHHEAESRRHSAANNKKLKEAFNVVVKALKEAELIIDELRPEGRCSDEIGNWLEKAEKLLEDK